jgi:DNA-binding transcriptional ArsR family regulator
MKNGPDIARVASLVGDPARANMLSALMGGSALTASELAIEAGVSLPTASSHLAKLTQGGLLTVIAAGRHRYYSLSGPEVATMLEAIMGVAATGPKRIRPGPKDANMREARICYDHLAGGAGVALLDSLLRQRVVVHEEDALTLGPGAKMFCEVHDINLEALTRRRRTVCRACLDWSVRRSHLAGALGAAILDQILREKWARRDPKSRAILFTPKGREAFASSLLAWADPGAPGRPASFDQPD